MPNENAHRATIQGMNNGLTVEKRMDKNGRWVTRHVKQTPEIKGNKSLPTPQLSAPQKKQKTFKPTEKQLQQTFYALDYDQYAPDVQLCQALGIDTSDPWGIHRFPVNEVTFYSVLSTTAADNAIALLGSGVRTPEEAQEKLRGFGLDHLIIDNSKLAEELLRRKVSPQYFTETVAKGRAAGASEKCVMDAAEAHSVKSIREWHQRPSVQERILNDAISYDDIKTIGVGRLKKTSATGASAIHALHMIHTGKALYDASELRDLLAHIQPMDFSQRTCDLVYDMAGEYGTDFVLNLQNFYESASLYSSIRIKASNKEQIKDIIQYWDAMRSHSKDSVLRMVDHSDIDAMRIAGVSPEQAMQGVDSRMTPQQIIAVHAEGISASVSSGWL